MDCQMCGSQEYLFNLFSMGEVFDENRVSFNVCLSCLNFKLRSIIGKDYLEVLSMVQKLDQSKYELKQKEISLHLKLKDAISKQLGKDIAKEFLNEREEF